LHDLPYTNNNTLELQTYCPSHHVTHTMTSYTAQTRNTEQEEIMLGNQDYDCLLLLQVKIPQPTTEAIQQQQQQQQQQQPVRSVGMLFTAPMKTLIGVAYDRYYRMLHRLRMCIESSSYDQQQSKKKKTKQKTKRKKSSEDDKEDSRDNHEGSLVPGGGMVEYLFGMYLATTDNNTHQNETNDNDDEYDYIRKDLCLTLAPQMKAYTIHLMQDISGMTSYTQSAQYCLSSGEEVITQYSKIIHTMSLLSTSSSSSLSTSIDDGGSSNDKISYLTPIAQLTRDGKLLLASIFTNTTNNAITPAMLLTCHPQYAHILQQTDDNKVDAEHPTTTQQQYNKTKPMMPLIPEDTSQKRIIADVAIVKERAFTLACQLAYELYENAWQVNHDEVFSIWYERQQQQQQ